MLDIDGERAEGGPEITALIPAGSRHFVTNSSDTEQLAFLSVYWPVEHGPIDL